MRSGFLPVFLVVLTALLGSAPVRAGEGGATPAAVEWKAGGTAYLAGRDITFDRRIDGNLTLTGETVAITRDAAIKGDVWIAARRVASEGDVAGDLSIRAQDALINGHVKGDVSFYGVSLAFGPDARIDGKVDYFAAGPAEIDSGARIAGGMRSKVWDEARKPRPAPEPGEGWRDRWPAPGYRLSWPGAVFFGVLAGIVALAAPSSAPHLYEAALEQPLFAFLIGLVWLVGTPIAAIVSAVTIVGLPLAFIVILFWPIGMLIGLVVAIMVLGEFFASRMGAQYARNGRVAGGVAIATVLLWVGISLPALGGLVWLAAVTFGVGALVLSARTIQ